MENIIRPDPVVLSDASLIPEQCLISPPPNQFTHEVQQATPYYLADAEAGAAPSGEFPVGMRVVLMVYAGGQYCRVVNEYGLYAEIEYHSLRPL